VVQELSDDLIKYIYKKTKGEFVIVGCGGVFSAEDAYKKIRLGASLIQLITGMIYEGPELISDINLGLVKFLKRDGFINVSKAVGIDNH
jgi:dihydroorotate dehydrogenase